MGPPSEICPSEARVSLQSGQPEKVTQAATGSRPHAGRGVQPLLGRQNSFSVCSFLLKTLKTSSFLKRSGLLSDCPLPFNLYLDLIWALKKWSDFLNHQCDQLSKFEIIYKMTLPQKIVLFPIKRGQDNDHNNPLMTQCKFQGKITSGAVSMESTTFVYNQKHFLEE